ncbi:SDR family NAD(P)-dependent oxidoreductase [Oceanomicrobium pacificus]|uniref:SDR family oxidoreductase n=1 Tax=Oceanomicrobium pacificus TaxID=2692916 RepID=A0A6B0TV91_9RHOB|nr:SDR family oxidoreductase [Oceanomicrobium pacificus]MXU66689.1 SDR family oxidoreductase [Oceanomicrobium pacificus]
MSDRSARYPDLADRSVLVSGGATGIGAALVRAFAAQGARVGFVDIDADAGAALATELASGPGSVTFAPCDLTDISAYQTAMSEIANLNGPVTVLANNAANDQRHSLDGLTPEDFDAGMAVNLRHALFAVQAVAPGMRRAGGGSIINFGSVGWMMAAGGYPVYAAAKAAVHGMTRGLARELGPDRIRVNTLVPGWVMTEKQLRLWVDEAAKEKIRTSQCLPDPVLPEDIAQMALFLGSDVSARCTAQNYIVDGGWV